MKTKSRAISILLTMALCLSMLSAALFVSVCHRHHCTGAECSVCAVIAQCEQRLQTVTPPAGSTLILLVTVFALVRTISAAEQFDPEKTPVSLKVKLLN
jgi:hypothetical protein